MRWCRDEVWESRLNQVGVSWKYAEIEFTTIDFKKSRENQARLIAKNVIDDKVVEYWEKMNEPHSVFKSLVVHILPGGKAVIIDGNHRALAYEALDGRQATIPVYVVDTDDAAVLAIRTRSWNAQEGMGQYPEEKRRHMRALFAQFPTMTAAQLATMFNVKIKVAHEEKRHYELRLRIGKLGYSAEMLSVTHLNALNKVANDAVLAKLLDAIDRYAMTGDEVTAIAAHVVKKRRESHQLDAIAECCGGLRQVKVASRSGRNGAVADMRHKLERKMNDLKMLFTSYDSPEKLHLTSSGDLEQARYLFDLVVEFGKKALGYGEQQNQTCPSTPPKPGRKRAGH